MNNKKIQANMQINVGFIADTTKLVKQVETNLKGLDLTSPLTKGFSTSLDKNFRDIFSNLEKMINTVGKTGLSPKMYQDFFNQFHLNISRSLDNVKELQKEFTEIYNSKENKEYLDRLKKQKDLLEEIKKISTNIKDANTRQQTNADKAKALGVDFNNSVTTDMLEQIIKRRQTGVKKLTPTQQASIFGGMDEETLKRVITLYEQFNKQKQKSNDETKRAQQLANSRGNIDNIVESLQRQILETDKAAISQEEYNNKMKEMSRLLEILQKEFDAMPGKMSKETDLGWLNATQRTQAGKTLTEIAAQFGFVGSITANIARGFREVLKYSFDFYKSLDSALNQIYVVSNLTSEAVNGLTGNFINMAKQTGMSIDDVTRAAVLFYQQGLNTREVMTMTEVTAQFAKVAGTDATDAADKLTAAVNGYCLSAEDAMSVADKFNKVAAASAADIDELSTAFSKAAAQANQAGVSMDNYLAYIATMEEATREAPENLGTSLKTIFSRMQQIKTGNNTEDTVDVNQVETALKSVSIELRDANGQLRDLEEIFSELGPKWQQLDRNTQAYLGTIIAGTRQQSRFITLMQNWDRVMELAAESENSAGQQALMHAKAMDSIESKLQQLTVAWQEFVSNLSSSSIFKGAIETVTALINSLNSGRKPLTFLVAGVSAIARIVGGEGFKSIQGSLGKVFDKITSFMSGQAPETENLKEWNLKNKDMADGIKSSANEVERLQNLLKSGTLSVRQYKKAEEDLVEAQKVLNMYTEEYEALQKKVNWEKRGAQLQAVGAGLMGLGNMIGNVDQNLGGLVSSLGGMALAIGMIPTNPWGAVITGVMAVIQAYKTLSEWSDTLKQKMTDSVNSVKDALQDLSNAQTKIKTTDELIKKYEQLSKMIIRTDKEQEELNKTIQELGDLHDVDIITDEFGNLHINITEVNEALKELNTERDKLAAKLTTKELDEAQKATSGLFNSNSIDDFYDELFLSSSSEYKSLLNKIDDKLKADSKPISSSLAKTFTSNLNSELVHYIEQERYSYVTEGFANAMQRMNKDFNSKLNTSDWSSLYTEIGYLEENLNGMSFNEVQDHLDTFYENWSANNKIVGDEWEVLRNSINNTIFRNDSLLEFYKEVGSMGSRISGDFYDKQLKAIQQQKDALGGWSNSGTAGMRSGAIAAGAAPVGAYLGGVGAGALLGTKIGALAGPIGMAIGALLGAAGGWAIGQLTKTDEEKQFENLQKLEKRLEKQKKEYAKELGKEWGVSTSEAQKLLDVQLDIAETMKNLNTETQSYLSNITELYSNTQNMTTGGAQEYQQILSEALPQIEGVQGDAHKTNVLIDLLTQNMDTASAEVKLKLQAVVDDAFNSLVLPANYTFTQLLDTLDSSSKDLQTMNNIIQEFNESGTISIDTFRDLAGILDNISLDNLYSISDLENGVNYVDQYINAIKNLELAFDEESGAMSMNGDALASLQQIQEAATKSKIAGVRNELIARRAQVEAEIAYIDAQIEATKTVMTELATYSKAYLKTSEIQQKADRAAKDSFNSSLEVINSSYSADVKNFNTWSTAILSGLSAATEAWGRYWKAVAGEGAEGLDDLYAKAQNATNNITWTPFQTLNVQNKYGNYLSKEERDSLYSDLESLMVQLENSRARSAKSLETLNTQINFLEKVGKADLSKWGLSGSDTKGLEQYIGKLKEIYNILNRIQVLEHRLGVLDQYQDIAKGKGQGEILQERLKINKELLDQYKFLTQEQKRFTNGYADFIKSVEGLEDVFEFDKYGQIIINFEKYNALQKEAAKGEVTLKEKADDVYNTYTTMFKDLQGYFDKSISYLKNVIKLTEQIINSYLTIEEKVASAIQEIYQEILNNRLDAIDKEKKAIEDLRKERERANKEMTNAKEIAGIQSDIQRAMMDTSGASSSALIKSQNALDEKLSAIAEDKYSEMLDNIVTRLDDEKTALQEEFDEMFSNLKWLFDTIEEHIMNDEDGIKAILTQTKEWEKSAPLRQQMFLEEWDGYISDYISALKGEGGNAKSIYDVWEELGNARKAIGALDSTLADSASQFSNEITRTLETWNSKMDSYANAVSGAIGALSSRITDLENKKKEEEAKPTYDPTTNITTKPNGVQTTTLMINSANNGRTPMETRTVNVGSTYTLPAKPAAPDVGYSFLGWRVLPGNVLKQPGEKITISVGTSIVAEWTHYTNIGVAANPSTNTSTFKPFTAQTQPWMPYSTGGIADYTGLAVLHGSPQKPEAVLNALQTKHFLDFTNTLDKMYNQPGSVGSSVTIDTISFNVESMSSPEDGERAFSAFVNKFNEIGSQSGLKINSFNNTNRT